LRPDDFWAYYRRGEALQDWGKLEEALQSYRQACDLEPDDYWAWYQQGVIWQQLAQFDQGINCYQRVLDLEPKSAWVWYQQACCYAALNQRNWAIICLEKAIDLYPTKYLKLAANGASWSDFRRQQGFQLLITNKSSKFGVADRF
jgi:tetratricopeptide (TPR) repeat protein